MSIDEFYGRKYDHVSYNCYHFSCDVWLYLTNRDLAKSVDEGIYQTGITRKHFRSFTELEKPVSPCLVIMQNPRQTPHMGVYYNGRILHFTEYGTEWQPPEIAGRMHRKLRYATDNH